MLFNLRRDYPAILGHRGAKGLAVDNSADAFKIAAAGKADGVELDVRRTADDEMVVHHDPDIEGVGNIIDLTLAEIRDAEPHVLLLDEALPLIHGIVNVEIKNIPGQPDHDERHEMASRIVFWIDRNWLHDRVLVSSFNRHTVARVAELDGRVTVGQLFLPAVDPSNHMSMMLESHTDVALTHLTGLQLAGQVFCVDAKDLGLKIVTWGVDTHNGYALCAKLGVDAIITDDPIAARAFYTSEQGSFPAEHGAASADEAGTTLDEGGTTAMLPLLARRGPRRVR